VLYNFIQEIRTTKFRVGDGNGEHYVFHLTCFYLTANQWGVAA
jgi:hypothetical protein